MTNSDRPVPSFFMLVPGPWSTAAEVVGGLQKLGFDAKPSGSGAPEAGGIAVDLIQDDALAPALTWGRQGRLDPELLHSVGACTHAALVEYGGGLQDHVRDVAKVGRALRELGGVAIRMEASGAASAWDAWLERFESGVLSQVYGVSVMLVRDDDDMMFTCGMHQFQLPDAQVAFADARQTLAWLDAFCEYQLDEQPVLLSGHTFRPDAEAPQRVLERWPDHRHDPSDGRHNPFGVWRLQEPADARIAAVKLVPTIMPSLVALLMATERSEGRPLTEHEVEKLVSNSTSIAMEPKDVRALERSRGYADIEPELAWEQWQIVRRTLE